MSIPLYLAEISIYFIGFVMLTAAWSKTKSYHHFTESLVSSFHLSKTLSKLLAPLVIILEWSLALILLTKLFPPQLAMQISLLLLSIFTLVVLFLLIKHEVVKCNCFGEESRPISIFDLIRNLGFIASIIFYLVYSNSDAELSIEVSILLASLAIIMTIISVNFHEMVSMLKSQGEH